MQTPIQFEFEDVSASSDLRDALNRHLADLEKRYQRVTACRVAIRGPGERHQTGGQYQVNIWLTLPDGREVTVARTPNADERHADLTFAVDDAFRRARRQLQDHARIMRGEVKRRARFRGP